MAGNSKKSPTRTLKKEVRIAKARSWLPTYEDQDDQFYYIAGYTSGGAAYGVTWAEMGLEPWEDK